MPVVINGTTGISGVDGSASTPALQGSDTNTGVYFGADTVYLVEGGAEGLRLNSSGNTQLAGNLGLGGTTPSTSGTGITFPATQSASSDANTLDDYEEGTWTATVSSNSGSITSYTVNNAVYTKIGRLVTLNLRFTISNKGTAVPGMNIAGVPFSPAFDTAGSSEIWNTGGFFAVYISGGTIYTYPASIENYQYLFSITYVV